jgi:hypothetical protein
MAELRRRDVLKAGAAGRVAAAAPAQLAGLRSATRADLQGLVGDGRRRRILLRGGAVLSLDARGGDFEKADVRLIPSQGDNVRAIIARGKAQSSPTHVARTRCFDGCGLRVVLIRPEAQ